MIITPDVVTSITRKLFNNIDQKTGIPKTLEKFSQFIGIGKV